MLADSTRLSKKVPRNNERWSALDQPIWSSAKPMTISKLRRSAPRVGRQGEKNCREWNEDALK